MQPLQLHGCPSTSHNSHLASAPLQEGETGKPNDISMHHFEPSVISDHPSSLLQVLGHKKTKEQLKERILQVLSSIAGQVVQCDDITALEAVEKHIIMASNSCRDISPCNSNIFTECKNKEPANKNIMPQRPFYSTKSKRKTPTIKLAKPTTKNIFCTTI